MVASVSGENNVLIYGSMMNTESNNSIIETQKVAQPKADPNINPEAVGSSTNLPTTSTVVGNSKSSTTQDDNKGETNNSPVQQPADENDSQKNIIQNYSQIVQQNIEASGSQPQQTTDGTVTTYSEPKQLEGYDKFFDNKIKETYANNTSKEPVSFFTLSA